MAAAEQLLCSLLRNPAKGGGAPNAVLQMVRDWKGMNDIMVKSLMDFVSEVDSREENVRVVSELLVTRVSDLEEKERDFKVLQEEKSEELRLREEKLDEQLRLVHEHIESLEEKEREFKVLQEGKSEELRLREEKLDEQLRLVHEHIESLEALQKEVDVLRVKECEKLKEIDKRERELDGVNTWLLEKRLSEVEKRERELEALYDGKLKELSLKEEVFGKERMEFAEEVRLTNEKLKEKQKLGCGLIERLEMALNMLGGMKELMDVKFKEIESREAMAQDSLTSRLNEADLIRQSLEKRFKELEDIEKELGFSQEERTKLESREKVNSKEEVIEKEMLGLQRLENKPEEKNQELGLNHGISVSCKMEHDYKVQDLEEGECSEKSPSSGSESLQNYVKENLALSKLDQPQRELGGKDAGLVVDKGQQVCRLGEVDLKRKMLPDNTGACSTIKQEQKEQKALEMLVNDPEKDLELMDDKIYTILSLSSDPAKLVLDALEGFHALCSGKVDTESRMKRATIILLDQLTKMSAKIQPCVKESAVKLAHEWKSKMSTTENPMEVSGFLRLLAAYNLTSHFDKNELFSYLKVSSQHKQTPDLCHALGLTEKIPGLIKKLINEKKFLLASTYIYEYQLQHKFSQASILNYYVTHSKLSANAKCRRECNSFGARDKAIASEIADLRVAIQHIIRYGLESEYSTNAITARIRQLEVNQASLRHGSSIPTTARAGKRRKASRKGRQAARESEAAPTPQMPCHGSKSWSTPGWSGTSPAEAPVGFPYHWGCVDVVQMRQPMAVSPYKRRRMNAWFNGQQQFGK